MTKLGCLLILFFSTLFTTSAQLRVAFAGGAHVASVPGSSNPGWDTISYDYSSRRGYHLGLIADVPFKTHSKFYFQTGMSFSNKGRSFSRTYDTSISPVSKVNAVQFINYMEIPANLVLKLNLGKKVKFMIGGGPYLAFLYNGKERKETQYKNGSVSATENKDLKSATPNGDYANFEYGVNGLVGFEAGRFLLTGNYSQGLTDFYKATNSDASFRHQVAGVTLGIYFTNPKVKSIKLKDRDKDGVADSEDKCPGEKGSLITEGCPDKDGDGVSDMEDRCPEIAGQAKYGGCLPTDTDKDGIIDEEDKCPDVAGTIKYSGCPIPDTDKDGVNDEEDKCIGTAGSKKYNGCPIPDTDKDGVNDEEDKCPSVKGLRTNSGCPEIKKELKQKVDKAARKIQFNYKSTTLTTYSKIELNAVARVLRANPDLKLKIEGHTSSDGNPKNHMKLSTARAESVKKFLEAWGIDPSRLKAEGFGASKPLTQGKSQTQLAKNRRVELKLTNF